MPPDGSVQLTPAERRVLRALEHDLRRGVLAREPDLPGPHGAAGPGPGTTTVGRRTVRRAVRTVLTLTFLRGALAVRHVFGRPAALIRSAWHRQVPGCVVAAAGLAGTAVGLAIGAVALRRGNLAGVAVAGYGAAAVLAALAVGAAVDPLAGLARRWAARLRARATLRPAMSRRTQGRGREECGQ